MAKKIKSPYKKLHEYSKTSTLYSTVEGLLGWDQDTYMPHGAIGIRSMQQEAMAHLVHKQKTSSKFVKLLSNLINIETGEIVDLTLSDAEAAAAREWRREYLLIHNLPSSFVKTFARVSSQAIHAWEQAKKQNSFKLFAPHLEKIVTLSRKKADYLGFTDHPYDALLNMYEPRMTTAILNPLFSRLKTALTDLLKQLTAHPAPQTDFLRGEFSAAKQIHFGHTLLKAMGFDTATSRLDQSAHPFCAGFSSKDTRMTTHIHTDQLTPSLFAVIHEGGHGLYNMQLPEEHFGSPLGEQISLGFDESQSRMWETIIGHSKPFWHAFLPKLQELFPEKLEHISLDHFYRAINTVQPSLIRIHADEVTYSLHIIVRFELEKAFMEGSLKVKDLPEAWNEKMQTYLGIKPHGFSDGCLQDIHWAMGAIGYFPTYTLGNLYAAQIFSTFEKNHPNWAHQIQEGNLSVIREWLKDHIHRHGKTYTAEELCQRLTGAPLSEGPYLAYLNKKYGELYR